MPAGRPKKPTSLKVLQGNPGKRPLTENEPKPEPTAPKPPSWLDAEAKREWKRIAPELERLGLLTKIDGSTLAQYCEWYSIAVDAYKAINAHRKEHKKLTMEYTNKNNSTNIVPIPEIAIAEKAAKQIKAFCTEFGLTPSARSGMELPDVAKDDDDFDDFIDHGKRSSG